MPTEIVVEAEDRPGMVAALGELLGRAQVNIVAAAAFTFERQGYIHLVLDHADRAIEALSEEGWAIRKVQEVMTVTLEDQPGELGRFARRLADSGINITSLYISGGQRGDKDLVVGVDDLRGARGRA
ncbi:MAG TPA: ACT domain-containing protein [Actinomycetota bacterium]|nr:ACT domain-containing protein [Actinomycetota bacterium]